MPTTLMSQAEIDADFKTRYAALVHKYGTATHIPSAEIQQISDRARALTVLARNPDTTNPARLLRDYWIPAPLIEELTGTTPTIEPHLTFSKKIENLARWCHEHRLEQWRPDDIAEANDISTSSVYKFIEDRPDLFRRIKRGVYEIRDVQAERSA